MSIHDIKEYIESGVLEMYVIGSTNKEESAEVERMMNEYYAVRDEVHAISESVENYAMMHAKRPDPTVRAFLMATIDYTERLKKGEKPSSPPLLHEGSKAEDYSEWLGRSDMILPENFTDLHAKIIGYSREVTTAIVWINKMAPQEVHDRELEKFMILEGTCNITIDQDVYQLEPGDFLTIPLYKNHFVTVTSQIPCKIILQRIAA
ncbi:MAG: cupin domain-containing protein [Ginsengibacter sp.]